ncbi:EamA family transporter [Paenibacillus oryzae]|nr:EamA family transporter [Paenibacillus oryzae]
MWNDSWIIITLIAMTLCGALGGAGLKKYAISHKRLHAAGGLGFYGMGALLNILLLKFLPLTVVLPANALTYVWTLVLAKWIFKEKIGLLRWSGVGFIMAGLFILVQ